MRGSCLVLLGYRMRRVGGANPLTYLRYSITLMHDVLWVGIVAVQSHFVVSSELVSAHVVSRFCCLK